MWLHHGAIKLWFHQSIAADQTAWKFIWMWYGMPWKGFRLIIYESIGITFMYLRFSLQCSPYKTILKNQHVNLKENFLKPKLCEFILPLKSVKWYSFMRSVWFYGWVSLFCFAPLPTLHWTSITSVMPVLWCKLITLFERIHWPVGKSEGLHESECESSDYIVCSHLSWQEAKDTWTWRVLMRKFKD